MKREIITANAVIKIIVLYQISCQTKCIIYQASIDCDIAGYNNI